MQPLRYPGTPCKINTVQTRRRITATPWPHLRVQRFKQLKKRFWCVAAGRISKFHLWHHNSIDLTFWVYYCDYSAWNLTWPENRGILAIKNSYIQSKSGLLTETKQNQGYPFHRVLSWAQVVRALFVDYLAIDLEAEYHRAYSIHSNDAVASFTLQCLVWYETGLFWPDFYLASYEESHFQGEGNNLDWKYNGMA